jgi:hypothetical protein
MRAFLTRDIDRELQLVLGAPNVRNGYGHQNETAFITLEIRHIAALAREEKAATVGIPEI